MTTPDGTGGLSAYPPIFGNEISGTYGCTGKGIHFLGTTALRSDTSIDVDLDMVACVPGLVNLYESLSI